MLVPSVGKMPLAVQRVKLNFFPGDGLGAGTNRGATKVPGLQTQNFFFWGPNSLVYHSRSRTLTTLKKASALLRQTSYVRPQNAYDVSCSIVSTCTSNRRDINLNICFASVLQYQIELTRYQIYKPKGLTLKYLNFAQIIFYVATYS